MYRWLCQADVTPVGLNQQEGRMSYGIGGRFTQVRIAVGDSGNTIQQIDRLGSRHCYRRGEWCSLKIFDLGTDELAAHGSLV